MDYLRVERLPPRGKLSVSKTSLCETASPDTGEVALAPEGERCPVGAEGENLAIARNISDCRTVLSPTACGRSPPRRGGQGRDAPFLAVWASPEGEAVSGPAR